MSSPLDPATLKALWAVLIAFHEGPGRYPVASGEPRLLFARVREVMSLAADRAGPVSTDATPPVDVRRAARFFVRTAMLRPGGSHYDVLGLTRGEDLSALREHYRLLIRMTHPDFSGDGEPWPDDAAARVNRAYDILSSPGKRADYDAQLKSAGMPPAEPRKPPVLAPRHPTGRWAPSRRKLGAYLSGALAAVAVVALAMLWPSAEDVSLGTGSAAAGRLLNLSESPEAWTVEPGAGGGAVRAMAPLAAAASQEVRGTSRSVPQPVAPGQRREGLSTERLLAPVAAQQAAARPAALAERPGDMEAPTNAVPVPVDTAPVSVSVSTPSPKTEGPPAGADIRTFQPVLADLLHMLETGQADRVQRWAARATQQEGSAERFADAYRQLMGDAVVTGLGQVRFDLKQVQERPVVLGLVQLRMLDRNQRATVRDFRLRAQFVSRANGPQLAAIDAE